MGVTSKEKSKEGIDDEERVYRLREVLCAEWDRKRGDYERRL